jgi:peptidoglycan/xylan/chitin deacetylase (PgdA/CDA1 family)
LPDSKRITPRQIADNVLRKAQPGSIILLHDGDSAGKNSRKNTVEALPLIIKGLRDRDLQIDPLSQLLSEKTYNLAKGKRIHD